MTRAIIIIIVPVLLVLSPTVLPTASALAAPDDLRWTPVNIPAEGKTGNWVLAKNSDVRLAAQAVDGTLYCYANPTGTTYTLFKSTDSGYSWSYTGKVEDAITAIATAPDNADTVYYATASRVYRSKDAGKTFIALALNPGGAGNNNIAITSIDIAAVNTGNIVAIGTRDGDSLEYGGIYLMDESEGFTIRSTDLGNYDVYAVSFSPRFNTDHQLIAVISNETSTFITSRLGNESWDSYTGRATIAGLKPVSASIVFPQDYSAEPTSVFNLTFVAINTGSGNGDVFRVEGRRAPAPSTTRDMNVGSSLGLSALDISGLALLGNAGTALLLAGATASTQVFISLDGGLRWKTSTKPPTGGSSTGLLFSRDYARSGRIYAFTSGVESAFSISRDGGVTWNQTGLIDTDITSINDLAISPDYSRDNTLFMLTSGGEHSLWRTSNSGISWERIYSSTPAYIDSLGKVQVSPQYADSHIIFISGSGNGNPTL